MGGGVHLLKAPRSPDPPRNEALRRARASRQPQVPATPPGHAAAPLAGTRHLWPRRRLGLLAVSHADQSRNVASTGSRRPGPTRPDLACGREPGTPGHATAGSCGRLRPRNLSACRGRRGPWSQRDAQPTGPMVHRSGLVRPHVPSVRSGPVRSGPGPGRGAGKRVQPIPASAEDGFPAGMWYCSTRDQPRSPDPPRT
jgi:hypothetical protein